MIEIKKGREPKELLEYRQKEYATYADMPAAVKGKVMDSLMAEQGYLCAYCMSRIDKESKKHRATIEHCIPQAVTDERERLNYKNMLAVCWGNRDAPSNEDKSCDAKRGSLPREQQIMKKINVLDKRTLNQIQYLSDGTIFSEDPEVMEDLTKRLNLNCEARGLKNCRLEALRAVQKKINKEYPNKTAPKEYLRELFEHYSKPTERKKPYCGIIISWLNKRI